MNRTIIGKASKIAVAIAATLLALATLALPAAATSSTCDAFDYEVDIDGTCVDYWNPRQCDEACRDAYWPQYREARDARNAAHQAHVDQLISNGIITAPKSAPSGSCDPNSDVCVWQDSNGIFHNAHNPNYVGPSHWDRYIACLYGGGGSQWNGGIDETGHCHTP